MANEARTYQNYLGGRLAYALPAAATVVADGATNTNTTVTSATAAFTQADVGAPISGGSIPAGAYITAVGSATSVTISAAATTTATGVTLTINRHLVMHSAALAAMGIINGTQHIMCGLDPDGLAGEPEIVMVIKHDSASLWAQITRAQRSTTARAHRIGTDWVHSLVDDDFARRIAVVKTADESVVSSTVLQDDDHLFFPVLSGQKWVGEIACVYAGAQPAKIVVAVSTPAGSTGMRSVIALGGDAVADEDNFRTAGSSSIAGTTDTGNSFGTVDSAAFSLAIIKFFVTAGADGNVRFRWCQGVSNATATVVRTGSHITADRIF